MKPKTEKRTLLSSSKDEEAPPSFINIDKDPTSTPLKVSNFPSVLPKPSPSSASQPHPPIVLSLSDDSSAEEVTIKESGSHAKPKLSQLQEIEGPPPSSPETKSTKKKRPSILNSSSEFSGDDVDIEHLELELDPPRASSSKH